IALAECCFETGGVGAAASLDGVDVARAQRVNEAAALFGESASRVLVSATPDDVTSVLQLAASMGVPAQVIGQTGGNLLRISVAGRVVVDLAIDDAERVWSTAIEQRFAKRVA